MVCVFSRLRRPECDVDESNVIEVMSVMIKGSIVENKSQILLRTEESGLIKVYKLGIL